MAAIERGMLLTIKDTAHDCILSVWNSGSGCDAREDLT